MISESSLYCPGSSSSMLQIWGNVYLASSKFVKIFSAKKLNKQKKNPKLTKKTHKQQQKKTTNKKPTKNNNKKNTQHKKKSVHFNQMSGWKIPHHLTNAQDAESGMRGSSKSCWHSTWGHCHLRRSWRNSHWEAESAPVSFWLLVVGM